MKRKLKRIWVYEETHEKVKKYAEETGKKIVRAYDDLINKALREPAF